MEAVEFFGEAVAGYAMTLLMLRMETMGQRFQEKQATAETQLRKLKDVRRDLIAAKARGDVAAAEKLQRELEGLQAWAATGPRAAAEVGAEAA